MSKISLPLFSLMARGQMDWRGPSLQYHTISSGIIKRYHYGHVLVKDYVPSNPQTSVQQANRSVWAAAVASWKDLPTASKDGWNFYQDVRLQRPVMSGYNLFIKKFMLTGGDPRLPLGQDGGGEAMGYNGRIKSGEVTGGSVEFGSSCDSTPHVVLSPIIDDPGGYIFIAYVLTKSCDGFTYHVKKHYNSNFYLDVTDSVPINWIATVAGND